MTATTTDTTSAKVASAAAMPDRLAFPPREIPALVGLGRSSIEAALRSGRLKSRRHGRRRVVLREDLVAWLASLPVG